MLIAERTYIHAITSNAVDLEACEIEAALRRGGYDPSGLDFGPQAAQRLVDEAMKALGMINLPVVQRVWSRQSNGGVELAIEFADVADVAAAKLVLG